jgi:hypothetical protein
MTIFTAAANAVLVVAALLTVWFAWQAAKASAEASRRAQESVTYARQTVEVARAAHEADEHARQLRRLQNVAALTSRILGYAQMLLQVEHAAAAGAVLYRAKADERIMWQKELMEAQQELGRALAGINKYLVHCQVLVKTTAVSDLPEKARAAAAEVERAIVKLDPTGNAG